MTSVVVVQGCLSSSIKGHGHWNVKCNDHISQTAGRPDTPCRKSFTIAGWLHCSATGTTDTPPHYASACPPQAHTPPTAVYFLHIKISTRVHAAGSNTLRDTQRGTRAHSSLVPTLTPWTADGEPLLLRVTFSLRQDFLTMSACGFMTSSVLDHS